MTKPARSAAKNLGGVAAGAARVTAAVNLRSSPRKGSSIAVVVPAGSAVNVLSCNGWCEVVYNGKKGWVYKNFLASSKPVAKQQAEASQAAEGRLCGRDRRLDDRACDRASSHRRGSEREQIVAYDLALGLRHQNYRQDPRSGC